MNKKDVIIGLFIALFLALLLSPFASQWPDSLKKVAKDKGFIEKTGGRATYKPTLKPTLTNYLWPGIRNKKLATSLAAAAGTLAVFGVGYAVAILLKKRKAK